MAPSLETLITLWPRVDRDRPSNAHMILGVTGFLTGLALIVVSLRLYVRQFRLKTFGWDDGIIALAMLHSVGVLVCFVGQTRNGGGSHWYDIGVPEEFERLKHWQYAQVIVAITGVSIVKISIGFALLRFLPGKAYRRFIIFMICFVIVYTIASEAPLLFECHPMHFSWKFNRAPDAPCISRNNFKKVADINGAINIITDFVFTITPIPAIIKLQISKRMKASLIGVLSLGFVACGTAIARSLSGKSNAMVQVTDSTWTLKFYIWNCAELNAGLLAASIPPLRPLVSKWMGDTAHRFRTGETPSSRSRSNSKYGLGSSGKFTSKNDSTRRGYLKQDDVPLDNLQEWKIHKRESQLVAGVSRYIPEDGSSEDGILSGKKKGITRQTEIEVKHEAS